MPPGGGKGNEVQETVQPHNKKDHARQISGDYGSGSHNRVLLFDRAHCIDVMYIDVNLIAPTTDPGSRFRVTAGEETPAPSDYLAAPGPTTRSRLAPPKS